LVVCQPKNPRCDPFSFTRPLPQGIRPQHLAHSPQLLNPVSHCLVTCFAEARLSFGGSTAARQTGARSTSATFFTKASNSPSTQPSPRMDQLYVSAGGISSSPVPIRITSEDVRHHQNQVWSGPGVTQPSAPLRRLGQSQAEHAPHALTLRIRSPFTDPVDFSLAILER
jgi:hypothetical protein